MSSTRKIAVALLVLGTMVAALVHVYFSDRGRWTTEPTFTDLARTVSGTDLVSERDPAVTMRFAPEFRHLGGQKFVLYGVADTEQHFFVETAADGTAQRLFWVQFEAYLPDNSYRYDYDESPGRLSLGDFDFHVDTAPVASDPQRKRKRGTDGAMARQFVRSQGFEFPREFFYARLVHLTDESRRKELMIIYLEDLEPQGLSATRLMGDGADAARWPAVEREHLARIAEVLTLIAPREQASAELSNIASSPGRNGAL